MKIGGSLKLFKIFPLRRFTSNPTDTNKKRSIRHYANLRFRILFKTGDEEDHQILHDVRQVREAQSRDLPYQPPFRRTGSDDR